MYFNFGGRTFAVFIFENEIIYNEPPNYPDEGIHISNVLTYKPFLILPALVQNNGNLYPAQVYPALLISFHCLVDTTLSHVDLSLFEFRSL